MEKWVRYLEMFAAVVQRTEGRQRSAGARLDQHQTWLWLVRQQHLKFVLLVKLLE